MMKNTPKYTITSSMALDRSYDRRNQREYYAKPRVYVRPPNETVYEDLLNRRARPYNDWKPVVLAKVHELAGDTANIDTIRWSQKAGCSCGCSPGFIIEGYAGKFSCSNVWMSIELEEKPRIRVKAGSNKVTLEDAK